MPYFGCTMCHHEWEGVAQHTVCDWCGSAGQVLEDETPLEKTVRRLVAEMRKRGRK